MTEILLDSLMPIFVVMALGYFAGWTRDIDNNHLAELNGLVMDFALPLSLFVATASTPRAGPLPQGPNRWSGGSAAVSSLITLSAVARTRGGRVWNAPTGLGDCDAWLAATVRRG